MEIKLGDVAEEHEHQARQMMPTILSPLKMTRLPDCPIESRFQNSRVLILRLEIKYGRTISGRFRARNVAGGCCRPGEPLT